MTGTMVQYPSSALRPPAATNYTVPPSQNTAPVLDFDCLFTYDIRRKAKRWHDGTLRFHAFNHRVMVYDEEKNLVGDTHERKHVENGDEFSLEKSGAIIQVGDQKGATQTDLSELLKKRGRPEPQQRPQAQSPVTSLGVTRQPVQHESPYSVRQRQAEFQREAHERRQATRPQPDDEHTPLWQILKRSKAAMSRPNTATRVPLAPAAPASKSRTKTKTPSKSKSKHMEPSDSQPRLNVKEIIEIPSDEETSQRNALQQTATQQRPADSDNANVQDTGQENQPPTRQGWFAKPPNLPEPSSSPKARPAKGATAKVAASRTSDRAISPPKRPKSKPPEAQQSRPPSSPRRPAAAAERPAPPPQANHDPSPQRTVTSRKRLPTPRLRPSSPPSSPPVSTTSRVVHPPQTESVDLTSLPQHPRRRAAQHTEPEHERPVKQLRLQAQAQRPMLFCQSKPTARPKERAASPTKPPELEFDELPDDFSDNDAASSSSFDDLPLTTARTKDPSKTIKNAPTPPRRTHDQHPQHKDDDQPDYSHLDAQLLQLPTKLKPPPRLPQAAPLREQVTAPQVATNAEPTRPTSNPRPGTTAPAHDPPVGPAHAHLTVKHATSAQTRPATSVLRSPASPMDASLDTNATTATEPSKADARAIPSIKAPVKAPTLPTLPTTTNVTVAADPKNISLQAPSNKAPSTSNPPFIPPLPATSTVTVTKDTPTTTTAKPIISALKPSRAPARRVASLHNPIRPPSIVPRTPALARTGSDTPLRHDTIEACGERISGEVMDKEGFLKERLQERLENGPWSIEAWDLFGCCYWPDRYR